MRIKFFLQLYLISTCAVITSKSIESFERRATPTERNKCIPGDQGVRRPELRISKSTLRYDAIQYTGFTVEVEYYSQILDKGSCNVSYQFFLNGSVYEKCSKNKCSFRRLTEATRYSVEAKVTINSKSFKSNELFVTTYKRGLVLRGRIECKNFCRWNNTAEDGKQYDSIVRLKLRSLACPPDSTKWQTLPEKTISKPEINLKDHPYSEILLSVWLTNSLARGKEGFLRQNNTNIAAPENTILEWKCSEQKCFYEVEKNCSKQNGPNVILKYKIEPTNSTLAMISNFILNGNERVNDYKSHIEVQSDKLHGLTEYNASATLTSIDGITSNRGSSQLFTTKPKAPLKVQNLESVSESETSIVIRWKGPPPLPITGKLRQFNIYWGTDASSWGKSVPLNKDQLEYHIKDLLPDREYMIKVEAINEGVNKPSHPHVITARTNSSNPDPPDSISNDDLLVNGFSNCLTQAKGSTNVLHQMLIVQAGKNETRNCSLSGVSCCNARDLPSGSPFSVSFRSCKQKSCSGWVLKREAWTKPAIPTLPLPVVTEKEICIGDQTFSDKKNNWIFIVETREDTIGSNLDHMDKIKSLYNDKNFTTCKIYDEIKLRICRLVNSKCTKQEQLGITLHHAVGYLAAAGPHIEVELSGFTIPFTPPAPVKWLEIGIGLGITGVVIISIFIGVKWKAGKQNKEKAEQISDFESTSSKTSLTRPDTIKTRPKIPPNTIIIPPRILEEEEPYDDVMIFTGDTRSDASRAEVAIVQAIHSPNLQAEFQTIPISYQGMTCFLGTMDNNLKKNRYKNNLPYDETRVVLPSLSGDSSGDYINASYIDTPTRKRIFIATQGPKCDAYVDTRVDFFRMVWVTNATHIIMVANLVEGGRSKVAQYWPEAENTSAYFGQINVALTSSTRMMDFIERKLTLTWNNQTKKVIQLQYTAWPDHGIPSNCYSLCQMMKVINMKAEIDKPIIVHCSAGIGRTGTILLVFQVFEQLLNGYIDPLEGLSYLRKGRPKLIENVHQYRFALKLIWECVTMEDRNFPAPIFLKRVVEISDGQMSEELENLKSMVDNLVYDAASDPSVSHLNRNKDILPPDMQMLYVAGYGDTDADQYINVVRVDAYDRENAFIVMEHPMTHTVEKAWYLAYKYKIPVWIMLNEFSENDKEFPTIAPKTKITTFDCITLEIISSISTNYFIEYRIEIRHFHENSSHQCSLIQILGWQYGEELPTDDDFTGLFAAFNLLSSIISKEASLISCGDGVTACGIFTSLLCILLRFELTQEVNVFNSVANILFARPQFITSLNQYKFLHKAIAAYIEGFSTYSNYS